MTTQITPYIETREDGKQYLICSTGDSHWLNAVECLGIALGIITAQQLDVAYKHLSK